MELLLVALIFWVLPIIVGISIGRGKQRSGGLYGLFLGWLGVVILAVLPPNRAAGRVCPFCAETIRREAVVCPHCQRDIGIGGSAPPAARSFRMSR